MQEVGRRKPLSDISNSINKAEPGKRKGSSIEMGMDSVTNTSKED